MDNTYVEYDFSVSPKDPASEILIAELGNVGFESFVETDAGVTAYIQKQDWYADILKDIYILHSNDFSITYQYRDIEQVNWNAEWENNFNPIQVADTIYVRAPFHQKKALPYDIVIEPKMSFGTGHHATTHMMLQHLLEVDVTNKKVLDMGCGTGILAIFADMKGATAIDAIDIDIWCYENAIENIERNACKHIKVYKGDASILKDQYDIILANINRNCLLNDLSTYANCLSDGGLLFLSGFYKADVSVIDAEAIKNGLKFDNMIERENWVAIKYKQSKT